MWNPSDSQHRFFAAVKWIFRAGAVTLLLGLPSAERAAAQPPAKPAPAAKPAAAPAATAPKAPSDNRDLRETITQKYEVLAVYSGVVLKPRTEELGVRTIEVSNGTIAVNGERVSEGVLRAWLGDQAEPILRLHRLPPAERQALFGLKKSSGAGEVEIPDTGAAPAATAEPDDSEAEEADSAEEAEAPEATPGAATPAAPEVPEPPPVPDTPAVGTGSRVKFGGLTKIDKDEVAEEAVAILGSIRVDGEVAQDTVAVGGSVVINGKVGGNVVAVGGSVHLGPNSEVMGDVTSVGGTIDRDEGSKVHGSTQDVGVGGGSDWRRDIDVDTGFHPWPGFGAVGLVWSLLWMIVLALLLFLCLLLGRRPVERAEHYIVTEPWKAALVGLLAVFLFLPLVVVVTVLLVITLIGCALILLYPFIAIFLAALLFVGYTASLHRLGVLLEQRFNRRFGSPYAVVLMGLVSIELWIIVGKLLGLVGGFPHVLGILCVLFGVAAHVTALVVGLGAVILDRLNGPTAVPPAPLVPAVPPVPQSPVSPALPLSETWDEEARRWEEEDEARRWEEPPPPER
jgi:hypothetical protein